MWKAVQKDCIINQLNGDACPKRLVFSALPGMVQKMSIFVSCSATVDSLEKLECGPCLAHLFHSDRDPSQDYGKDQIKLSISRYFEDYQQKKFKL